MEGIVDVKLSKKKRRRRFDTLITLSSNSCFSSTLYLITYNSKAAVTNM